jgi:hypothetical protein
MDGSGSTPETPAAIPPMPEGEQVSPEADVVPPVSPELQGSGLDPEDLKVPPMFKSPEVGTIGGPGSEVNSDMMAAAARATADSLAAGVTRNEPGDPSKQILPPPPEIAPPTEVVQAAEKIVDLPPTPPPPAA